MRLLCVKKGNGIGLNLLPWATWENEVSNHGMEWGTPFARPIFVSPPERFPYDFICVSIGWSVRQRARHYSHTLPPTMQVKFAIVLLVSLGTGFRLGSTDIVFVFWFLFDLFCATISSIAFSLAYGSWK